MRNRRERRKAGQGKVWSRRSKALVLAAVLCLGAAETGCGRKDTETASYAVETAADQSSAAEWDAVNHAAEDGGENGYGSAQSTESAGEIRETEEAGKSGEENGQKLIRTKHITAQTKAFDENVESLEQRVEKLGGYVEYSSIDGGAQQSGRYADYTLRIPAEKLDEFSAGLSTAMNIVQETEQAEDVTLDYVDVESHIEALETEKESLMKLLEQADSVESILAIQSQLTQVRYELESYTSRRRVYDNRIDYATVYLNIHEVAREEKEDQGFWTEVGNGISDSFQNLSRGARTAGVFLLGSLPYWLALAAAGILVWLLVRGILRLCERGEGKKSRKMSEEMQGAPVPQTHIGEEGAAPGTKQQDLPENLKDGGRTLLSGDQESSKDSPKDSPS